MVFAVLTVNFKANRAGRVLERSGAGAGSCDQRCCLCRGAAAAPRRAAPGKAGDGTPKLAGVCRTSSHVNRRRATAFGSVATIYHS